ncbi:phosphatase PAP2 family protein [Neptunomonas concharum]|uniref:undecaprenyl-diphosphate phosphatase n=1 Tax=Neptunomonas concharum TaxID=1031538 RepID=A0A5P1RE06_9GAMM|nr:phosphatase PAP2 family protein [Neptunomonas concharum]QEQ97879.1 phosphatase PAP2 family protein [Neptunomonas concharum]
MRSLQALHSLDTLAFHWFQAYRNMHSGVAYFSRCVSRLGDGFAYAIAGLLLAVFEPNNGSLFLQTGLIVYLLELPLYLLLKNTIRRCRPSELAGVDALIQPSDKFSFPSGHSAAAFVFATLLVQFYPQLFFLAYSVAALIGLSRVMLGVHYPSDIVAGAALGVVCAEVVFQLLGVGV